MLEGSKRNKDVFNKISCKMEQGENVAEDTAETKLDESESSSSRSETPADIKAQAAKGKKRKRSVSDEVEEMESLVEKVMKMQSESEQHYLRLEEKMLEMEEQRQKVMNFSYK